MATNKTKKPLQRFTSERRALDQAMSKEEIARFLHDFQVIAQGNEGRRKLISLRVPEKLLAQFRVKARMRKVPYQSQIVDLMRTWLFG